MGSHDVLLGSRLSQFFQELLPVWLSRLASSKPSLLQFCHHLNRRAARAICLTYTLHILICGQDVGPASGPCMLALRWQMLTSANKERVVHSILWTHCDWRQLFRSPSAARQAHTIDMLRPRQQSAYARAVSEQDSSALCLSLNSRAAAEQRESCLLQQICRD